MIEVKGLVKQFGPLAGVDGLTFTVPAGSVFGFLGPNGAGKTTTIRILMGLARPTAGEARILGFDTARDFPSVSSRIGYLPETPAFYSWMTGREYLVFCAEIFGLKAADARTRIEELLDFAGLADARQPVGGYSRGMKQRLGLAQALINDPHVLILDEPTSALDPKGRKEVLDMISRLAKEKTVFFSTHILADVERVCDRVALIDKGKLVVEDDLPALKRAYLEPVFTIEFGAPADILAPLLSGLPWVVEIAIDGAIAVVRAKDPDIAERELPKIIAKAGLPLRGFQIGQPSLEQIFMKALA